MYALKKWNGPQSESAQAQASAVCVPSAEYISAGEPGWLCRLLWRVSIAIKCPQDATMALFGHIILEVREVLWLLLTLAKCNLQGNNQFYGQDPQQMNNGHYRGGWHGPPAYPPMFPPVRSHEKQGIAHTACCISHLPVVIVLS